MEKIEKWISNNKDIEQELIRLRRHFHEHPEVGHPLPQTQEYIVKMLEMYGYENIIVNPGGSIEILVGPHDKKILLLRSDMDALPLVEHTNLPFKSINGSMHACGHDMHASMMLMCAKLLKQNEKKLKGQIKIVFQPHEEGLVGCKMMIEDGVLKYPRVDAAVGLHVMPATEDKTGTIRTIRKAMTTASTIFEINITGKSSHGSMPEKGIDALRVAIHIYQQLQEIIPKEISMSHDDVLTIGIMNAGKAHNIIPEKAYMKCSLRSYRPDDQEYIMGRVNASFSKANSVCLSYSPTFGNVIWKLFFSSSGARSKKLSWPSMTVFFSRALLSSRSPETMSFCFLVPGSVSRAPDFMKLSSVLLLTSLFDILDTKSSRLLKSPPFSRSAMITSTTARPTLLIAESP